jgi:UDP-N-acetylmuramoylalanine--D-glutamate ligase
VKVYLVFKEWNTVLEKVLKIQNVQYINDSKATQRKRHFFALDSMNMPTVWIVGGVDKGTITMS